MEHTQIIDVGRTWGFYSPTYCIILLEELQHHAFFWIHEKRHIKLRTFAIWQLMSFLPVILCKSIRVMSWHDWLTKDTIFMIYEQFYKLCNKSFSRHHQQLWKDEGSDETGYFLSLNIIFLYLAYYIIRQHDKYNVFKEILFNRFT